MRKTIPALTPASTAQMQALKHEPQFPGIDLDMPPPRLRLRGDLERPPFETLVTQASLQVVRTQQSTLCG